MAQKQEAQAFDPLDSPMTVMLVERFRVGLLKTDEDRRTGLTPEALTRSARMESNELCLDALRDDFLDANPKRSVTRYAELADELAQAEGLYINPKSAEFRSLCVMLQEADFRVAQLIVDRDGGAAVPTPEAPAAPPPVGSPQPSKGYTLDMLIADYTTENLIGRVTQSTLVVKTPRTSPLAKLVIGDNGRFGTVLSVRFCPLDDYGPVFRLLRGVLGPERHLSAIGRAEGKAVFAAMKGLPANASKNKQLKGLSVLDMIEKGKELGLPTIGPKTITAGYLAKAKALFNWAHQEERMTAKPLQGLRVHDPVAASDKRDPFTMEQLKALFGKAPWSPRDPTAGGRPIRYWGPLIALFHGMRLGEIAQLDVADVETIKGAPMLLIRAGGGKKVKTENSKRSLPIHPELQRMGLLDYIEGQRKAGAAKLFPGEGPNNPEKRSQWGVSLGRWFQRQIEPLKSQGKGLGVHAFRHTFQDALREADLHGTPIGQELAGRSKGGDVSNNYGSGYSTAKRLGAMSAISYPELDLSPLYPPA